MTVTTTRAATEWLRSLPGADATRVLAAVRRAAERLPDRGVGVKPLGPNLWEVRSGEYRLIFTRNETATVLVLGCRREAAAAQRRALARALAEEQ